MMSIFRILFFICFSFFVFRCNDKKATNEFSSNKNNSYLEPSEFVKKHNDSIYNSIKNTSSKYIEQPNRGFIAGLKEKIIYDQEGNEVFNIEKFNFVKDNQLHYTVNPILWRQSQLNSIHGLFEVTKGIYQVRGYDIAVITFIEGNSGWIVIDPLASQETSEAAYKLVSQKIANKPVKAIIFTHSHIDHYGGAQGILKYKLKNQNIPIIAPSGFYEEATSENIVSGYLMARRSQFMYGLGLDYNKNMVVGTGLNQALSKGKSSLIKPSLIVSQNDKKLVVDGIEFVFQLTPGAEAPSEFMFYLPKFKAFCHAEEMNQGMHNLYTPRGAKVRDGLLWSKYLDYTLKKYSDKVEVSFGSHHWPVWGNKEIKLFYKNQRDLYKFIHDQTLNWANKGYNATEIAEKITLPKSLDTLLYNKGIYGNLKNNIKGQYQLYFGWFDGHPSNINRLTPKKEGAKLLEYMGGEEEVIKKAKIDYEKGQYRFVATILGYVVEVNPKNIKAKELLAKTYLQLAYMQDSGPLRNFYISGADELTQGVKAFAGPKLRNKELIMNMTEENIFNAMSVTLNAEKVKDKNLVLNFNFTNNESYNTLYISNGVLNYVLGKNDKNANSTISMSKETFAKIALEESNYAKEFARGNIKISGNPFSLLSFGLFIDKLNFNFPLVLPIE